MASAGFYVIHNTTIRFGRDGRWYADDELIVNQRIADLFSRHIEPAANGDGDILRIGDERAPVIVEDTPYVFVGIAAKNGATLCVELNDHTNEALNVTTLRVGDGDVLYCRVKSDRERARFLRPAYYQIAQYISEPEPGQFVLRLTGSVHQIEHG